MKTGVKQGFVLTATPYSILIAFMCHLVKNRLPIGGEVIYSIDNKLFNFNQLASQKKTTWASLIKLQLVDNMISAL